MKCRALLLLLAVAWLAPEALGQNKQFGGRLEPRSTWADAPCELALDWLSRHQDASGRWVSDGLPEACDSKSSRCKDGAVVKRDVRATAAAALAFMADGQFPGEGEHQEVVAAAIEWLQGEQEDSGLVRSSEHETDLDHAVATLALCQAAYFAEEGDELIDSATAALRYAIEAEMHLHSEPAVVGHIALAMSGRLAGGQEDLEDAAKDLLRRLRLATRSVSEGAAVVKPKGVDERDYLAMTAVTLLVRIILEDGPHNIERLSRYAASLNEAEMDEMDWATFHFSSLAIYQLGGPHWFTWSRKLEGHLTPHQRDARHMKGSCDPRDDSGGRIFFTALFAMDVRVSTRYRSALVF